jgi:hypothetical protein
VLVLEGCLVLRVLTTAAGKVLLSVLFAAFVLAALMVNDWNPVQAITSVWNAFYSAVVAVANWFVSMQWFRSLFGG